ncbi:hypothetical protein [Streptomyces sp. NPDC058847]
MLRLNPVAGGGDVVEHAWVGNSARLVDELQALVADPTWPDRAAG